MAASPHPLRALSNNNRPTRLTAGETLGRWGGAAGLAMFALWALWMLNKSMKKMPTKVITSWAAVSCPSRLGATAPIR